MSVAAAFADRYGRPPTSTADAPGRVNLIGEHTDYNDGYVLPIAIPARASVATAPRDDDRVRIATTAPALGSAEFRLGAEQRSGGWSDYVQGCTAMLRAEGHPLRGFDLLVDSTVPDGAGLASSAALEVAIVRTLRSAFDLVLDDVALALLAHRAECDFVGARVGVMDQFAASLGDERTALFLDTRTLASERVPLPDGFDFAVIDSGVGHRHASGGYNTRRAECERAATLLGLASLRDLGSDANGRTATLPPPLDRRARHVVRENARVLATVAALRVGDLVRVGALLNAGHASLRDDFEVSTPEVDCLAALATDDPDVLGARLTGGGFGGAVLVLTRPARSAVAAPRIAAAYAERYPGGRILVAGSARGGAPA